MVHNKLLSKIKEEHDEFGQISGVLFRDVQVKD
jgi:hypothetical protein